MYFQASFAVNVHCDLYLHSSVYVGYANVIYISIL